MHKQLPNIFIFLNKYNDYIFKKHNINIGVIYRNYKAQNRKIELNKISKACKKYNYQLFISNDIKLAINVKANGIYIPSFNKKKRFHNIENNALKILGSAHNQKQIFEKIGQKCQLIFLSPTFFVKKSKNFLGLHKFNYLSHNNKIDLIALGGINETNISTVKLLNTKGFAGISVFKKKPAYKRPVFLKK